MLAEKVQHHGVRIGWSTPVGQAEAMAWERTADKYTAP